MRARLTRLFVLSAGISVAIYFILFCMQVFWPDLLPMPLQWWLLPFLFAVGFIPRAIGLFLTRNLPTKYRRDRDT